MLLKDMLALNEPLKNLCSKRLSSFRTARLLSKTLKKVEEEIEIYSKEQRKLLDTYAKKDEKGNFIPHPNGGISLIDAEAKVKYEEALKKLLETDVGMIATIKVSESEFTNPADFPTPQEMVALEPLIDWDVTNEPDAKN